MIPFGVDFTRVESSRFVEEVRPAGTAVNEDALDYSPLLRAAPLRVNLSPPP